LQEKPRHSISAILRLTVLARQVICLTMKSLREDIVFQIRIPGESKVVEERSYVYFNLMQQFASEFRGAGKRDGESWPE